MKGINLIIRPHGDRLILRVHVDDAELHAAGMDAFQEAALGRALCQLDAILSDRNPGPLERWIAGVFAPAVHAPPPGQYLRPDQLEAPDQRDQQLPLP